MHATALAQYGHKQALLAKHADRTKDRALAEGQTWRREMTAGGGGQFQMALLVICVMKR